MPLLQELKTYWQTALAQLPELKKRDVTVNFTVPKEKSHGDLATTIAFQLAKQDHLDPVALAQKMVAALTNAGLHPYIKNLAVAGPGFINLVLSQKGWQAALAEIFTAGKDYGRSQIGKKRAIYLEYGSENIAKPMSIGHLRSNIIGQAVSNIYHYLGWQVIADSFVGDWGTQFGKLIVAYRKWGDGDKVEANPIPELVALYQRFHEEVEKDPTLEEQARAEFKKLETGDAENRHLWDWFVKESFAAFDTTHQRLGIALDLVRGESFYEKNLTPVIAACVAKGITTQNKDGSIIVNLDEESLPPLLIQKSDGATLYATRDLAAIQIRLTEFKPERIVYFVDHGQELHFRQLFAAAKKLGWRCQFVHAYFGTVNFKGKRMSTRAGHVVYLEDLLERTVAEAHRLITEKGLNLTAPEKHQVAEMVGIGAVIYNDLSQNRVTDIEFSWEKALDFDGNTAPYLQYTYARARSILAKAEAAGIVLTKLKPKVGARLAEAEAALLQHALTYPMVVQQAAEEYKPNLVANFSYALAQHFNNFYNALPVLKAAKGKKELRLGLVLLTADLLQSSLGLLGVKVPAKM